MKSPMTSQVALNQLCLAPVVITSTFSWNLCLQGQAEQLPRKLSRDLLPTMQNGWKFWVPAASVNFYFIPLQHQVRNKQTSSRPSPTFFNIERERDSTRPPPSTFTSSRCSIR
jgi:hypothetical protein